MIYGQAINSGKAEKRERNPDSGSRERFASALLPTRAQLWGMLGVLSCVLIAVVLQLL